MPVHHAMFVIKILKFTILVESQANVFTSRPIFDADRNQSLCMEALMLSPILPLLAHTLITADHLKAPVISIHTQKVPFRFCCHGQHCLATLAESIALYCWGNKTQTI